MSMNPGVPGASLFAALRRSGTLRPLRHRTFAAVWFASMVSNFGGLVQTAGASWLMTTIAPSSDFVAPVDTVTFRAQASFLHQGRLMRS